MGSRTHVPLEVDHLFIWVARNAPEAETLQHLGLQLSQETTHHTGQGTASVFFDFDNIYLELLWGDDPARLVEISEQTGIDMASRDRWRETSASPFGIAYRRRAGYDGALPFPTRPFWAEWMKPNTALHFADDVAAVVHEPLHFVVPDGMALAVISRKAHALGITRLTGITITVHGAEELKPSTSLLAQHGVIAVRRGLAPLLDLTFDHGETGQSIDVRPTLPLILRY